MGVWDPDNQIRLDESFPTSKKSAKLKPTRASLGQHEFLALCPPPSRWGTRWSVPPVLPVILIVMMTVMSMMMTMMLVTTVVITVTMRTR